MKKIAVIGAGPAGLIASIAAADKGATVTLFERNEMIGKKLLLTGNGRCNFTNTDIHPDYYSFAETDPAALVLDDMSVAEVCSFFMDMGVLSVEKNGCYYPFTRQAQTIQKAFECAIKKRNINVLYNACVGEIQCKKEAFTVLSNGKEYDFDAVILACGGKAAPKTGSDGFGYRLARGFGHTVSRTYPVLVQLISDAKNLKMIAGVRCHANVTAVVNGTKVAKDYGELQLTEYGISGIPVFNISRFMSKEIEEGDACEVLVDFLPQICEEVLDSFVSKRINDLDGYCLKDFISGLVHNKLADYFIKEKGLCNETLVNQGQKEVIVQFLLSLKAWKFRITGHKGFENAQVTKGGVILEEIDGNMQSKLVNGLYFAGEMVDVDADCGGYNLHWAWASGKKAGEEAAK